jgi:hypothetical protein
MTIKLVKNWKRAHRWLSMRFLAASAALQAGFAVLPDDLRMTLPAWLMHGSAIALLVCAALGRLLDQSKGDNDDHADRPSE